MQTILVSTDFSSSARNAISYAAALAREMKAKLILFHSFQIRMPSPDFPVVSMTVKEFEKKAEKILQKESARIRKQYQINVITHVHSGFYPSEEILRLSKRINPDLIVLGMKEKGFITKVLVGSTVTSVIRTTKIPVMIIPEKIKFIKPKKILLSFDDASIVNRAVLAPLLEIANIFQSEIYVVNVIKNETYSDVKKTAGYLKLERSLSGLRHVYYFPKNKNFKSGINDFLVKHEAVMMAMIPHRHDLIERIFGKSKTKDIAFHIHIPLLALPDRYKRSPTYFI